MKEKKSIVCIVCPRGCLLEAEEKKGEWCVTGFACPRGEAYGREECIDPRRNLSTVIPVSNRKGKMLPVKTSRPVKKAEILPLMAETRRLSVEAPVRRGEIVARDLFGTDWVAIADLL